MMCFPWVKMRLSLNWIAVEAKFSRATTLPIHVNVPQPGWVMVPPWLNANRGRPLEVTPVMPRPFASWPTEPPNPILLLTKETQLKPTRASFTRLGVKVWVQLTRLFFRFAIAVLCPISTNGFEFGSFCLPWEYRLKKRSLSDRL